MKIDILNVNYINGGKITVIPTKMIYEQLRVGEFQNIRFEVNVNKRQIQSRLSDSIEYAVKYLQKELPDHIGIACCQSCQNGHFNPFGDSDNEIACLKDMSIHSRAVVVDIFSNQDKLFFSRRRRLLDFCEDYKPITKNEQYIYNDWGQEE